MAIDMYSLNQNKKSWRKTTLWQGDINLGNFTASSDMRQYDGIIVLASHDSYYHNCAEVILRNGHWLGDANMHTSLSSKTGASGRWLIKLAADGRTIYTQYENMRLRGIYGITTSDKQ